jgi:GR25 family glycosyltransferase involved in LPS biosynthesis
MVAAINTYILYSPLEKDRTARVEAMRQLFKQFTISESIYQNNTHIPFLKAIIEKSKERTGKALMATEVACLLGHRRILRQIVKAATNNEEHFLVLESDSKILDFSLLETYFEAISKQFDIFFWGAWNNHVSIKRSTKKKVNHGYRIGTPMIKSLYGTYGYSLNPAAAKYLLKQSKQINHPVDYYKCYVNPNEVRLGAIQPEVVSTWQTTESNVRVERPMDKIKRIIIIKIFHLRNQILAYFC